MPSVLADRLLSHSIFGDSFGRVYHAASNNIHEVISLGSDLARNSTAVFGGRMDLKIVVRNLSDQWKPLESEYAMVFSAFLVCWDYRDKSL